MRQVQHCPAPPRSTDKYCSKFLQSWTLVLLLQEQVAELFVSWNNRSPCHRSFSMPFSSSADTRIKAAPSSFFVCLGDHGPDFARHSGSPPGCPNSCCLTCEAALRSAAIYQFPCSPRRRVHSWQPSRVG